MRWGSDDVGLVLTRNEIWLLLHALADAKTPAVDWEGNRVEPWVVGELHSRLQSALRPEPLSDVEERPVISLDSEMGRSLAQAGVRPLVLSDGYDLGSLLAACADRGWGATLSLPVGGGPMTPAEAVVTVGNDRSESGESPAEHFVGLERPVVAMARALIGAVGSRPEAIPPASPDRRSADEYIVPAAAINPGERHHLIQTMTAQGWEFTGETDRGLIFRRTPKP